MLTALYAEYVATELESARIPGDDRRRRTLAEIEARICATIRRMCAQPENTVRDGVYVFHVFEVMIGRERLSYFRVSRAETEQIDDGFRGYSFSPGPNGVESALKPQRRRKDDQK